MKKPRTRMPISQRAKQFAPFKSLAGLDEAIRRAEEEHRRELEAQSVIHVPVDEESGCGASEADPPDNP